MANNLENRNGVWYFRKVIDGRRFRKSTGFKDRKAAERRAAELEVEAFSGTLGWVTSVPTFGEWAITYQKTYSKLKRSPRRDKEILAHALPVFESRRLDEVTQSVCAGYMHARREAGAMPGTINRERGLLSSMWNAAIRDRIVASNPWKGLPALLTEPRRRVLAPDEQRRLLPMLNDEYRRFVVTALGTGLRENELLQLRREDVGDRLIAVRAETAKGQKYREVPVRDEVRQAIDEQIVAGKRKPGERLWNQTPGAVLKTVKAGCRRAAIEPVTVHDLRRTFGTRCALRGMPMTILRDIMGHSSMEVTAQYYVHAKQQDLTAAMERVDLGLPISEEAKVVPFRRRDKKNGHTGGHTSSVASEATQGEQDSDSQDAQSRRATGLRHAPTEG